MLGIFHIFRSDQFFQIGSQFWITVHEPSSESNPICLIIEFLRINVIERFQFRFFQNLCVKRCNPIDCISKMNIDVCHMYTVHLIDDIHTLVMVISSDTRIQFPDDRHQMRHYLLEISHRPFFQRLCKDRMVCVCTCLSHNIDGGIHIKSSLHQKTNQFWDHHCRMGIVDLHCHMLMQSVKVISMFLCLF